MAYGQIGNQLVFFLCVASGVIGQRSIQGGGSSLGQMNQ